MHVQTTLQPHGTTGRMTVHEKLSPEQQFRREGVVSLDHRDNPSTATPTVTVTAVGDRRAHEVREIDLPPAAQWGRYPTLCGQTITAASMAEPARRRCPRCDELRDDHVAPRPSGLLRRLVGR
jgi:hypothetical protein